MRANWHYYRKMIRKQAFYTTFGFSSMNLDFFPIPTLQINTNDAMVQTHDVNMKEHFLPSPMLTVSEINTSDTFSVTQHY